MNNNGFTVVFMAALKGNLELMQALLADTRTDINVLVESESTSSSQEVQKYSAIKTAAANGHIDLVRALLADKRLKLSFRDTKMYTTLVSGSLSEEDGNHMKLVRALLTDSHNPLKADYFGKQ